MACQPITGCSVKALLTVSHLADRLPASFAFKAPDPHRDISGCQVTAHGLSAAHVCPSSVYTHIQHRCVKSKHHDSELDSWSLFLSYPGIVRNDVFYRGLGLDLFFGGMLTRLCEICNHSTCHNKMCTFTAPSSSFFSF